jgi:hypothetical protein
MAAAAPWFESSSARLSLTGGGGNEVGVGAVGGRGAVFTADGVFAPGRGVGLPPAVNLLATFAGGVRDLIDAVGGRGDGEANSRGTNDGGAAGRRGSGEAAGSGDGGNFGTSVVSAGAGGDVDCVICIAARGLLVPGRTESRASVIDSSTIMSIESTTAPKLR